jgi:hypothetical protein
MPHLDDPLRRRGVAEDRGHDIPWDEAEQQKNDEGDAGKRAERAGNPSPDIGRQR